MPKRTDIHKILIIGAGPIVIGQACEFDYSGTQACKALKEEGYKIILINSNPATIMTDPDLADRTYIEPIIPEIVERIIEKERPDALLPTMGGQTALNTAVALAESGVLEKYGVELIGAKLHAIKKAEDRELFKEAMKRIGLEVPRSGYEKTLTDALSIVETMNYPVVIRPSFTLGGTGGGIAYNSEEFKDMVQFGLDASPYSELLIEESVIGWKEYELEVMRDGKDNVVVICSIENFDPMGVHTGDSITVAPAQTLTDKEYQIMRDAALKIIREIGVDTGGSNIQFSVSPDNGKMYVIEMNPRVSRSSALASKATGFPIAKIAAKLAVGYTLDEIPNDITKKTPASFEPTIDYVVTKIPRFAFEKFPQADATLTTQMKSVGEAMAIGRTFKESLHKAMRSLEIGSYGFESRVRGQESGVKIIEKLRIPNWERLWYVGDALRVGMTVDEIFELSKIDRWFLNNIKEIVEFEEEIRSQKSEVRSQKQEKNLTSELLRQAKEMGFSDKRIAQLTNMTEKEIRELRNKAEIKPVYKTVDTCGAEFEAFTPYLYSSYEKPYYKVRSQESGVKSLISDCEANPSTRKKVMILGSGPNRIGQGIEFDYCCVHASFALKEEGIESIMVNCNPETVSTDYDTSDRLYFEPLTFEDVMNIIEKEKPFGVIVQFGGQTPLKLAVPLERAGVEILGTSSDSIDIAEDRERFDKLLSKLNLKRPESGIARSIDEAIKIAERIAYPVMVRPSYVLGGRAMEIVYTQESLRDYMKRAKEASPEHPVLIDKFLNNATEVDVDCISDGTDVVIGGIMEHIEEAGIHSGDSACSIPPYSLKPEVIEDIRQQTIVLARELKVAGLMNVQFAVKKSEVRSQKSEVRNAGYEIYVLEVNPRASRTVPFVSKAIGKPLAKLATKVMIGRTLKELGFTMEVVPQYVSVKESVFPFIKFPGVDTILGPEMKSTGEVMGIDEDFGRAFAKAQIAAGTKLPLKGNIFISVKDDDKNDIVAAARQLKERGFTIVATSGTARHLKEEGVDTEVIYKVGEGRPHIVDRIKSGEITMVINTSFGMKAVTDSYSIRRSALVYNVPYFTTIAAAKAASQAIVSLMEEGLNVRPVQEYLEVYSHKV
ncbi:MAG: carbamoyl phosphate synthase large subunit [Deltaproteobacteria bacterium RIFCSPLOWO2_02_44_9]|nr:MAG: carbamoyl phosphate synthase large subunit [Deltaproteobacteria bacterium RIFCSPLOWO2_02_44_9]